MDSYLGLSNILNLVDASIQIYVQSTYQALSSALAPTLKLLMILYVVFFGIGHLTGHTPFNLWRTLRHLAVMVVVSAFVTQWDFFTLYFANLFTNGPGRLMAIISGGSADPNAMLGDVLDRGVMAANAINQTASVFTLGFLIVGYSLFYMTLISVAYALYLLVLSKIALSILLGLAPFFFLFLLFDATRDFFVHYFRQVFNFALIPIFTAAVLSIMLKIPQQALMQLQSALAAHSGHGGLYCVYVLLSFFILLGLLHQVTGLPPASRAAACICIRVASPRCLRRSRSLAPSEGPSALWKPPGADVRRSAPCAGRSDHERTPLSESLQDAFLSSRGL